MSAGELAGAGRAPGLRLDHIGIQVRDLDRAAQAFERLFGYRRATEPVVNSRHRTRGLFLEKPGSLPIKLVTPLEPSARERYGLHHLAFITDDVGRCADDLHAAGARVLSEPAPGEMFGDELIAFLFAAGINVELVSTDRWAKRLTASDE